MQDLIEKTVDMLKLKVKKNLKAINKNQKAIKILLEEKDTPERAAEFEQYYGANKTLLQENNDFINIQLTLINFLEKYKGTAVLDEGMPVVDIYSISDEKEVLELTLNGIVNFDDKHPKYNDSSFIDRMIQHYGKKEEYEKCSKLLDLKSKLV